MKFYTNKISTGKSQSFSQFIEKIASANSVVKTASKEKCAEPVSDTKMEKSAEPEKQMTQKQKEEVCLKEPQREKLPEALKEKIVDGEKCEEKIENKSDGAKEHQKKEGCYASADKMVRIANLDSKTKNEWKNYWKKMYPAEYVDAMFADR